MGFPASLKTASRKFSNSFLDSKMPLVERCETLATGILLEILRRSA